MGLFSKKGDYIDYSLLQKRGLLKVSPKKENDFLDLTRQQAEKVFSNNSASNASGSNPLASFFDDSSSASNSLSSSSSSGITTYGNESPADLSSLKIKIEDIEYKLERLIERLNRLELGNN